VNQVIQRELSFFPLFKSFSVKFIDSAEYWAKDDKTYYVDKFFSMDILCTMVSSGSGTWHGPQAGHGIP
jgi:hypothetical protein